jgi:carbon monoxide dehydrogenase subunit G
MKRIAALTTTLMLFVPALGISGEISTSQTAEVKASAEQVWALLIDADNWAAWNPAVDEAALAKGNGEDAGSVVKFVPVINGKKAVKVKLTLAKSEKPGTYEFTARAPGMKIVFGFSIEEKEGICTVTSYETIKGPGTSGFEALYGQEGLDKEHQDWGEAIKNKLESENK